MLFRLLVILQLFVCAQHLCCSLTTSRPPPPPPARARARGRTRKLPYAVPPEACVKAYGDPCKRRPAFNQCFLPSFWKAVFFPPTHSSIRI